MPMLQPGEQATRILLWETDDPSKHDDSRFWWSSEQRLRLPDGRELSGPKGTSLAELRERSGGDEIELEVPPPRFHHRQTLRRDTDGGRTIKISTADWGDPDRTFVIISHSYRPTAEEAAEEKARRGDGSPFPADAEAVRHKWLAALEAGEQEAAAELEAKFDETLAKQGWIKPYGQPNDGVEIQRGVYLLDARPQPAE